MTTQEEMLIRMYDISQLITLHTVITVHTSTPKQFRDNLYRAMKRRGWKWKFRTVKNGVRIERSG